MNSRSFFRAMFVVSILIISLACQKEKPLEPPDQPKPPVYEGDVLAYCLQPGGNGSYRIHTIGADGNGNWEIKIAGSSGGFNYPGWSPDGKKLVLVGYVENFTTWSIHTVNADGTNLTRLTTLSNVNDYRPAWSPDGSKIAFTRIFPAQNNRNELWVMNADGGNQRYIGVEGYVSKWSPDGTKFIYSSNRSGNFDIFTCNIDGTNETQLTYTNENETEPEWSPDGRQITYENSTGVWESEESRNTYEIFVMNADGSGPHRVTDNSLGDFSPKWSPDGSQLSFVSDRSEAGHWEVYVMNTDGNNVKRLTNSPSGETAINPAWRPRG